MLWERPSADLCVGGAPPLSSPIGVAMGPPLESLRRCVAAGTARTWAPSHPSRSLPSDRIARSALAGTSTRSAERTGGFGATAYVLGVVAAATTATADLSAAHHGHSREVRAALKKRCVPVCVATCTAVARPDAAVAAAALPWPLAHDAHDSRRPVWRVGTGLGAIAAPLRRAVPVARGGHLEARNRRNGRRARAAAAGAGRVVAGSVRGVRGAHAARSAAATRPPRRRHLAFARPSGRNLAEARSMP